ncbi:hypothetical protein GCWU000246_00733 [Jonquetella anthropi E3_33 E1]|nr:hypothetical protein GCWU000246_00733 [Jonquetella anthropi E3_33 E1]
MKRSGAAKRRFFFVRPAPQRRAEPIEYNEQTGLFSRSRLSDEEVT